MKKLIVFSVVFALLATFAFAQADFSAGGAAQVQLMGGNSGGGGVGTGFDSWFWVSAGKTNDDNTMGAKGSFSINTSNLDNGWDKFAKFDVDGGTYFYAWWQPLEQVFLKVGKTGEDGKYWAGAGVVGWDFQSNDLLISPAFNYYNGFPGSILPDSFGYFSSDLGDRVALQLSIIPLDLLTINLGFKFDGSNVQTVFLYNLAAQVVVNIPGAGQAAIGFKNSENGPRQIALQYKQGIGDKMKIEVGIKYWQYSSQSPIDVGIGFGYGSPWGDTFWLNARIGAQIPLNKQALKIAVDICPSYDLGIFRVYVPVGFGIIKPNVGDMTFGWSFNPYIRKQMGGLEFWAGLKLYNGRVNADGSNSNWYPEVVNKDAQGQINWAVPIALLWAW